MALSDRDYTREGSEPRPLAPVHIPDLASSPPPVPPLNPNQVGTKVRDTTADYTGRVIGDLAEAAASIALLLFRPVEGVDRIARSASNNRQVWLALLVNLIGWVVVISFKVVQLDGGQSTIERLKLLGASTATLLIPFVALTAATAIVRRVAAPPTQHSVGYDALGAAAALLPIQVAGLATVLGGETDWTRWLEFCSYLLCALILYGAAVQNTDSVPAQVPGPKSTARLIYLVPLQISAAILIAAELTSKFAPDLPWAVHWMK
jgi:hypothetical protein